MPLTSIGTQGYQSIKGRRIVIIIVVESQVLRIRTADHKEIIDRPPATSAIGD
jgi:hypothetical protein